jgi:hypothetical protein
MQRSTFGAPARSPRGGGVNLHPVRRLSIVLATVCLTLALTAPVALAGDEGQGLWGETNDKVVTFAGFILIAFFPLFIATMSFIQGRLEKRKDARLAARRDHAGRAEWRGGW